MRRLLFSWVFASATLLSGVAHAQVVHVVREGQNLARIAQRYSVNVGDLAGANGLRRDSAVRPGQELRIPEQGVAYVRDGQTLSHIARAAGCPVSELVRINRLREGQTLQLGQRIVLPGFVAQRDADAAASRWGRPRNPGSAQIYRTATRERTRVRLLDPRGRSSKAASRRMAELMRPRNSSRNTRYPTPNPRLLELLARVSDHFGGREIQIISGFRSPGGYTRETSQHVHGHALDISIRGVPHTALRDYLKTFDHVGVGFYPRSRFVHMDVRDRKTYWVDWSRPGEAPRYQRRGEAPPSDATPEERVRVGEGGDDVSGEDAEGAVAAEEGVPVGEAE